jgi:transglutaminase-like putative cysteine protease
VPISGTTAIRQDQRNTWTIDAVLWGLLALLLVPLVIAMQALPWASGLMAWVMPVALASGLALGAVLVVALPPRRWWRILLGSVLALGLAFFVGVQIIMHGAGTARPLAGTVLLGAFLTLLGAALPWLIFHAKQPWIAVALVWMTLIGAWGASFTAQRALQLVWLLVISLALIGFFRLREEMQVWQTQHLERLGPVLWPTARAIMLITLLIALVGLIPFGIAGLASLQQLLRHTPLAQGGPLSFDTQSGTPVAVLGAPLSLNTPDVSGTTVILRYQASGGVNQIIPPLLGATLDTFDGTSWSLGNVALRQPDAVALTPAPNANTVQAKITLAAPPPTANAPLLLGFSNAINFSVSAQVHVISGTSPGWNTITDWQPNNAIQAGHTYTTSSVIVSGNDAAVGTLDPTLTTRMTAVPAALTALLQAQARQMVGTATTPVAQANALINRLAATMKLDPAASAPKGVEPISWFLSNKRGNTILWTTTYILLARSIGLPMRLAEGYLPGQYDAKTGLQVVRASDATVWAQLAIPGRGWLDLFPVAHVQTVIVPGAITTLANDTPTPKPTVVATPPPQKPLPPRSTLPDGSSAPFAVALAIALLVVVVVLGFIAGVGLYLRVRWASVGQGLPPLPRIFARVALLARFAGIRLCGSDTASQATEKVIAYLPHQQETLTTLNRSYERFVYGPPEQRGLLPQLNDAWQRLSKVLWQLIVNRPWRRTKPSA